MKLIVLFNRKEKLEKKKVTNNSTEFSVYARVRAMAL